MFLFSFPTLWARTITNIDKIVYEVISETEHTVRVAIENQSLHRDNASAITIPVSVTDPESGIEFAVTEIAEEAFKGTAITSIDIQAKITAIGTSTFQECRNLSTAVLPETLTWISNNAFYGCPQMKAPTFPEGLKNIGMQAFADCMNLGEVTLPSTTNVNAEAFLRSHITKLNLPDENNGIVICPRSFYGVTGLTTVKIPSWWKNLGASVFEKCQDLTSVDFSALEDGTLQIEQYAFSNCSSLTSVQFPERIDYIGTGAFQNTSLTEIKIPAANTLGTAAFKDTKITKVIWGEEPIGTIRDQLFMNTPITEITFPAWMTAIPSSICWNCSALTSVTIREGTESIGNGSFTGIPATEVLLPSTLKTIAQDAFSKSGLEKINLNEGLQKIMDSTFNKCRLTEITIPSTVTTIGDYAFSNNQIVSIHLPETDNSDFTPITFGKYVFNSNLMEKFSFPAWMTKIPEGILSYNKLRHVDFAEGTEEVGTKALANNYNLVIGDFPPTIKKYGSESFYYGGSLLQEGNYLGTVYIGNGVEIDSNAFAFAKLKEVIFTDCDYTLGTDIFKNVTSIRKISFPECMTQIPDGICNGWVNLTEVVWPPRLEAIGKSTFKNCPNLNFGTDSDGNGNILDLTQFPFQKLTYIDDEAFSGNPITEIIWPDEERGLTLEDNVFSGISTLTSAHIPGWMDEIPNGLFRNCSNLTELIWDESGRTSLVIGDWSFMGTGISEITWPDVPTTLNNSSFGYCKSATRIIWPESPAVIGRACFDSCTALTEPTEVPDYITSIPYEAFRHCTSLPSFTLHAGVLTVRPNAFRSCTGLTEFTFEGNVPVVEEYVFGECTGLHTVNFSYPVTAIKASSFISDSSLRNLNMPAQGDVTLSIIGESAFQGCSSIEVFPDIIDGNTLVENSAFLGASSLRHIILPSGGLVESEAGRNRHIQDAAELQAIDFKISANNKFTIYNTSFENAPLKGVSSFAAILPQEDLSCEGTASERDGKGILLVGRDMKYRLMENGFGNIWDIRETKNPQLRLYGDIHSTFAPGDTHNRYKAMIRWEIVESDLNEKAPTVYHLRRDGAEIARIEIGVPRIEEAVEEGNIKRDEPTKVFPIRIIRDGMESDKSDQYGDFSYELSENLYTMVYSNQHRNLYFHPETSHRIGLNERMGINSWFLYIDEFDSPDLNQPDVPDHYTYTLAMEGYDYEEPVNNGNYLPGDDSLYWHYEPRTLPAMIESEPCVVHTSMAVPSLTFDGVYTLEQVKADTDGTLPVSNLVTGNGEISLSYAFANPSHILHRLQDSNTVVPVIDHITSYEIPSRSFPTAENEWETIAIKGDTDKAEGEMIVPAEKNPRQGSSFQIVTFTTGRGTFGSRIVTIPGAPDLMVNVDPYEHCWGGENHPHDHVLRAKINIQPLNLDRMGYNERPDCSRHTVGVWRSLSYGTPGAYEDFLAENHSDTSTPTGALLFHAGDDYYTHSWACSDCRAHQIYDTAAGMWNYTDHFSTGTIPAGQWNSIRSDYRVRLYVQTPDDPSKWMIAEAEANRRDIVTGTGSVNMEASGATLYFNLQGMRVEHPVSGDVLIRVDRSGAHKIRF